jgi:dTDP-4-amino-4,6-dideoxygalactose transaminase
LFVIRVGNRDVVSRVLKEQGIATGIHYPVPLHRQPAFAKRVHHQYLPITEQITGEILTLPLYPELKASAIERIADAICHCPGAILRPGDRGRETLRLAA